MRYYFLFYLHIFLLEDHQEMIYAVWWLMIDNWWLMIDIDAQNNFEYLIQNMIDLVI